MSPNQDSSNRSPDPREEIFYRALEIEDPRERQQLLEQDCDPETRQAVEDMLLDHARANSLFDTCSSSIEWTVEMEKEAIDATSGDSYLGAAVGNYQISNFLGKGATSFVYEAQQETPVKRVVALKILRPGLDSKKVIDRFNAERQTLAIMEHPNIASVLDAGTTEKGHPYFVMERVRGARINDFCNRKSNTLAERIRLIASVCGAVQHAHQKGIIHLDLKPSNILVSEFDDTPLPKVIDFGIAQALGNQASENGIEANPQLAGTPRYMSPEQASGKYPSDIRSDVFSLGIILAELARDCLPSQTSLPSDLSLVIRKATDPEPEKRYQTVRDFAKDLKRFLENKPVDAHPPSSLYWTRKLLARNRLASTAIGLAILAILSGLTISTILLFRARAAEQKESELRIAAEERERVTRTANLIMQGKLSEADREIEQLAGPLTQTSVEAAFVFWELGIWNSLRKDWQTASDRLLALVRVNQFDEKDQSDNATRNYLPLGPTLVEADRIDEFWSVHQDLIRRKGGSKNPIAAEQLLKGGLLLPGDEGWLSQLAPLASVVETSLAPRPYKPGDWLEAWRCAVLGLWHYRSGNFDQAIEWSQLGLEFEDEQFSRIAYCQTIMAMSHHRLGHPSESRALFDAAKHRITGTLAGPLEYHMQGFWHDWVAAGVLLKEAEQLYVSAPL